MKKRILIMMHYMEIGGAEASLIGMLQSFDYSKVDVDLFVYSHQGDFMHLIPPEVNLLPEDPSYALSESNWRTCLKAGHVRQALAAFVAKVKRLGYNRGRRVSDFGAWFSFTGLEMNKILPSLKRLGRYDLAISFVVPHRYVLDKVDAVCKVGWIHTDYTKTDPCREIDFAMWSRLDKIVSISDDVTKSFLSVFPELEDKIVVIENIISPEFVRHRAEQDETAEYIEPRQKGQKILCTLGRISPPKNFDNLPYMAKGLKDRGVDFHWFVLGPGDVTEMNRLSIELGVADVVTFLGPRSNPYPYVKNCDVYVQPSRFEGKSVAVREAQILGKPVVITNYATASCQVKNGCDGIIVQMDNESIAEGIAVLLKDLARQKTLADYLSTHDYGNVKEVEKIYQLATLNGDD